MLLLIRKKKIILHMHQAALQEKMYFNWITGMKNIFQETLLCSALVSYFFLFHIILAGMFLLTVNQHTSCGLILPSLELS